MFKLTALIIVTFTFINCKNTINPIEESSSSAALSNLSSQTLSSSTPEILSSSLNNSSQHLTSSTISSSSATQLSSSSDSSNHSSATSSSTAVSSSSTNSSSTTKLSSGVTSSSSEITGESSSTLAGNSIETQLVDSVSQYGITWYFATPVKAGLFFTGDYFILDEGEGITVTSVSPGFKGGKNGSQLNPMPGDAQGLDNGATAYDEIFTATFPLQLKARDALISSITIDPNDANGLVGARLGSNHKIKSAAVLTVLPEAPPKGSLRPSYMDPEKTIYNIDQINPGILPSLTFDKINITLDNFYDNTQYVDYYQKLFQRPWLLFVRGWSARQVHPYDNMPSYHEVIGRNLSRFSILMMSDIPMEEKELLLPGYIQVCIDYFYGKANDSSNWSWPVVLAGLLLNEEPFYNFWINNPSIRNERGHYKLYYVGDKNEQTASSIVPAGQTWFGWQAPNGKYPAFCKSCDIGVGKANSYAHLHPSEWECPDGDGECKSEVYHQGIDVYPIVGMVLSSILMDRELPDMDINSMLAHSPTKDYIDFWMSGYFMNEEYENTGRTYFEEMIFHQSDADAGGIGSAGGDEIQEMWDLYR